MDSAQLLYLIAGAAFGGFINGLAGFGTALFALGFWLQVFPPLQAVAMTVAVSALTGLQGLWEVRREIGARPRRLARYLVPAVFGIPLGIYALAFVRAEALQFLIAGFMMLYGLFFLLRRRLPVFDRPTPVIDSGIGFAGGVLGGLAGVSGALPAMWCGLRPWSRQETRAVLQPFNVAVLGLSAVILAVRGAYTWATLQTLAVALIVALLTAQLGIVIFRRMSNDAFRWTLIVLMFLSGVGLMARVILL